MQLTDRFPTRLQYNADKELLFITYPGILGREEEDVVEMEHLEITVPHVNIGTKFMTANDEDGYYLLKDLNKGETYYLNRRAALWNPQLREAFLHKTTRLWDESVADSTRDPDAFVFTYADNAQPRKPIA